MTDLKTDSMNEPLNEVINEIINETVDVNLWPQVISFKSFNLQMKMSTEELYTQLYEQYHCSIRNKRIAVKNLQNICESTFLLANEVGFQAMTLRQLSQQTGMSMGGLYAYIKSKDDLAELIHRFLNKYCIDKIDLLVSNELTADKKLIALIHAHVYLSELMQPWFYFTYMESKNLPKTHKNFAIKSELSMENLLLETMNDGLDSGIFNIKLSKPEDTQLAASLIKAMLQDWYLKRWKYKKRKISADDYASHVVKFAFGYLNRTQ